MPLLRSPLAVVSVSVLVLVLLPVGVPAVTMEDCEMWLSQLRGEADGAQISGEDEADARRELVKDIEDSSSKNASETSKAVASFQKRARKLAADGKVSATQGKRLQNLSDTVRHCLEQVEPESEEE